MSDKWPRARVGFLSGASLAILIGVMSSIQGAIDGDPAIASLALGGMSLSIAGALLGIDRLYPAMQSHERRFLVRAFSVSLVIYVSLLALGVADGGRGVLAVAGVPATITGAYAMWLAARPPRASGPDAGESTR